MTALVAASAALVLGATPALADVGLPYTFHVEYISGGDSGVRTPNFRSNSSGRLCVDPDIVQGRPAEGPPNHYGFYIQLWKDNTLGDDQVGGNQTYDARFAQPKKCWTGVPHNANMYVRIRKTEFRVGQTLTGSGVVSYT